MVVEQFFSDTRLVLARRLSQSDCREEAFAHGSVYEIGVANSMQEFNTVRSVAEITANMCDSSETLDIWMEDTP